MKVKDNIYLNIISENLRYLNLTKKLIIIVVIERNLPLSISDITREIHKKGYSYNYRTIWQQVMNLNKRFLELKKEINMPGSPIKVRLNNYYASPEVKKIMIASLKKIEHEGI